MDKQPLYNCPKCGRLIPVTSTKCPHCGAKLEPLQIPVEENGDEDLEYENSEPDETATLEAENADVQGPEATAAHKSNAAPVYPNSPRRDRRNAGERGGHKWLIILFILLDIAVLGVVVWLYVVPKNADNGNKTTEQPASDGKDVGATGKEVESSVEDSLERARIIEDSLREVEHEKEVNAERLKKKADLKEAIKQLPPQKGPMNYVVIGSFGSLEDAQARLTELPQDFNKCYIIHCIIDGKDLFRVCSSHYDNKEDADHEANVVKTYFSDVWVWTSDGTEDIVHDPFGV